MDKMLITLKFFYKSHVYYDVKSWVSSCNKISYLRRFFFLSSIKDQLHGVWKKFTVFCFFLFDYWPSLPCLSASNFRYFNSLSYHVVIFFFTNGTRIFRRWRHRRKDSGSLWRRTRIDDLVFGDRRSKAKEILQKWRLSDTVRLQRVGRCEEHAWCMVNLHIISNCISSVLSSRFFRIQAIASVTITCLKIWKRICEDTNFVPT